MATANVYVTQVPHRRDAGTGAMVPAFNITSAEEYGKLVIMMPPRASFHATAELVKQLRTHLANYDYERGDSIVALGDPSIIAAACALLGKLHGNFRVLKWDRNVGRYFQITVNV